MNKLAEKLWIRFYPKEARDFAYGEYLDSFIYKVKNKVPRLKKKQRPQNWPIFMGCG